MKLQRDFYASPMRVIKYRAIVLIILKAAIYLDLDVTEWTSAHY